MAITILAISVSAAEAKKVAADGTGIAPHFQTLPDGFRYDLPPEVKAKGLVFARKRIPIKRADVRERILKQINYLLLDRRSRVILWLSRADTLSPVILPVLKKYYVPKEFLYLSAIESSYDGRALSSAGAFGFWQFIKSTARTGPVGCKPYDWKMEITKWKDERGDLVCSTNSAARYLAWMNRVMKVRLKDKPEREGFRNWLLTAAAYNAGPGRVVQRMNAYGESSYWDLALPTETEKYVPRWIAISLISKHRKLYGVDLPKPSGIAFDTVRGLRLKKDLTMTAIARLLKTSPRTVWALNSQIPADKGVFPAKSRRKRLTHTINIPSGTKRTFINQLKAHGYLGK